MPFFPSNGTAELPTPLNNTAMYVSGSGSNSANGLSWFAPKKTAAAAYLALPAAGGTIYFTDNVKWSDGTEGHGLGDSQGIFILDGSAVPDRDGWLRHKPVHFVGVDSGPAVGFGTTRRARMICHKGAESRFKPAIWLSAGNFQTTFENMITAGNPAGAAIGGRIGVDYARNDSGSVILNNVTNAVRTSGSTVLTVVPVEYNVISASRSGGVVTMHVDTDQCILAWDGNTVDFVFDSSDEVNFPSGSYTSSIVTFGPDASGYCILIYTDGGSNIGSTSLTGSTVASHGAMPNSTIELQSTDSDYKTSFYRVTDTTDTTITVIDPYGADNTSANIGTYVTQDRFHFGCTMVNFRNFQTGITGSVTKVPGPGMDFGCSSAGPWLYLTDCTISGIDDGTQVDPNRCAPIYVDGGSYTSGTITCRRVQTQAGGMRCYTAAAGTIIVDEFLSEDAGPAIYINSRQNLGQTNLLRNVQQADYAVPAATIQLVGTNSSTVCDGCDIVTGPCTIVGSTRQNATLSTGSPSEQGQFGTYNGGLSGQHPAARRVLAPRTVRYQNWAGAVATWAKDSGAFGTSTGPDGMANSAVTCTPAVTNMFVEIVDTATEPGGGTVTWSVGDRVAIALWAKNASGINGFGVDMPAAKNGPFSISVTSPISGDGEWFYLAAGATVASVDSSHNAVRLSTTITLGTVLHIYQPTLVRVPNGEMSDDEFAEFVMTLQTAPTYLKPGFAGTNLDQKLVAHGGLATAKRYTVGGGAGQITIGAAAAQAIEVFDESGVSLGVLRPSAFTVN